MCYIYDIQIYHYINATLYNGYTDSKTYFSVNSRDRLLNTLLPIVAECEGIWVGWGGFCYNSSTPIPAAQPKTSLISTDKAYITANQYFGEAAHSALLSTTKANKENNEVPLVWFNNYQLLLAPVTVRQRAANMSVQIGLNLYTPFPQWDVFRLIPWASLMLQGMLECDVISFNTERYCLNFMDCCRESLGCKTDEESGTVMHVGRTIKIIHMPIGVNLEELEKMAGESPNIELGENLVILGVDSLDYIKGIPYKLYTFERFLEMYPEFWGKVVLLQILIPKRTSLKIYKDLKNKVDELVGRINGKFGNHEWVPIRYIYKNISQEEVTGYYRDSQVFFFTPLSDGTNLRGKEYVACQIKESPGVLILSQFSGVRNEMKEALICNLHDIEQSAETLKRALTMSESERILRMNNLRKREKKYNIHHWKDNFLEKMTGPKETTEEKLKQTPHAKFASIFTSYCKIEEKDKLGLILDYEGTIVPTLADGSSDKLPNETKQLLEKLSSHKDVHLCVVSEGKVEEIKKSIGCDKIIYAGYNGFEIHFPSGNKFSHSELISLKQKISELAQFLTEDVTTKDATIINKGCYLIYNYKDIPEELQERTMEAASAVVKRNGFEVTPGSKRLIARLKLGWSKGRAVIFILTHLFGYDWEDSIKAIYAGNDENDEDVFKALNGLAISFQVSYRPLVHSSANRTLPDTNSIVILLQWLDKHLSLR